MAVAAPPRAPRTKPDPEALIPEARQRQRRRWLIGTASLLALVTGAALFFVVDRGAGSSQLKTADGAPIAAGCPSAPKPHFGSLGAVAYVHRRALRVVDLATGKDRLLARVRLLPPVDRAAPAGIPPVNWSPDGRWLTAGSTIVAAATGATCVPFGRSATFTWFPNRDALIVDRDGRYSLAAPGQRARPLLPAGFDPAGPAPISSDGSRLVAVGPHGSAKQTPDSLWVFNISTGKRYLLWTTRSWDVGPPTAARWSPDGRWVLFETDEQGSGSIAGDGLPLLAVPIGEGPLVHVEPRVLTPADFVQSCGSGGAMVVSAGSDRYVSANKRLDLIAPPTWRPKDVSRDRTRSWYAPSCSPDGSLIAATTTPNRDEGLIDSAQRSIWLVSRNGSSRRLLVGSLSDEQPRWSRDGRWILYVEHSPLDPLLAPSRLYLVNVSSGKRRGPFGSFRTDTGYYGYHDWNELAAWYKPR